MSTAVEKKLQAMRVNNADARRVFDALREYENNMTEIAVTTLYKRTGLRERAIRAVLEDLEQLELGKLVIGRRGKQTRFEWFVDYTDVIPAPLKGEPTKGDTVAVTAQGATLMTRWVCKLRAGREAQLFLPANATNDELRKVLTFVKGRLETA